MMPGRELLEIYKANGGKYVTIGSDAHVVEDVGADYVMAKSLLEEVGLQEVADAIIVRISHLSYPIASNFFFSNFFAVCSLVFTVPSGIPR